MAIVDGETVGAVSVEAIASLRLQVGCAIDADALEALRGAVRAAACHDRALDALARRGRARGELARWLRDREFSAAEIDPVLDRLTELGLLDDRAFARGFVQSRMAGRAFGPRRVAADLARRGVDRRVIDETIAEFWAEQAAAGADDPATDLTGDVVGAVAPEDLVARAAASRLRALRGLDPVVARRRLVGWLARRGFGIGESVRVAARLLSDEGDAAAR